MGSLDRGCLLILIEHKTPNKIKTANCFLCRNAYIYCLNRWFCFSSSYSRLSMISSKGAIIAVFVFLFYWKGRGICIQVTALLHAAISLASVVGDHHMFLTTSWTHKVKYADWFNSIIAPSWDVTNLPQILQLKKLPYPCSSHQLTTRCRMREKGF